MTRRVKSTSKTGRSIVSTSEPYRRIDPAQAAKALGAEEASEADKRVLWGSAPALFALRQAIYQRLRSTGGRRGLEGARKRHKIPLIEGDWERLQEVAKASRNRDIEATPAQVACLLLHQALDEIEQK